MMASEYDDKSWGAERALVLSKIKEFTDNQTKLFELHHTLSESVTVIKTKLGMMVVGVSGAVSAVVALASAIINAPK